MPYTSEMAPIIGGKNAPPATAITRKDAPRLVCGPKPLIASAKIVGNMIDIKKNTPYKAIKDGHPKCEPTTGNSKQTASE